MEGQDRAYGEILLGMTRQTRFWRLVVGCGSLCLFAISLALFWRAINIQQTVPVLVNVMPSGEAQYLGEVRQEGQAPAAPEAAVVWQVRQFVTDLRSVSTDPQVLYDNIENCYAMVTSKYEPVMTRFLRGASPFDLVGKTRRGVQIESVIKATESTYQIDWLETTTAGDGTKRGARMRALVTVKMLPVSGDSIKRNPLGIYIDDFQMTEL